MTYITLSDLSATIRANFQKIPHDLDFVLGVPRSGILCGSIIAEFLNLPLVDVDSFVAGAIPTGGRRVDLHEPSGRSRLRALVVDDTIFTGGSMIRARQKLSKFSDKYDFIFCAVYLEGPCSDVDVWLEDLRGRLGRDCPFALYEWNILHHTPRIMTKCIYDIDGVLCVEAPDERNIDAYIPYIKNAVPLFVPSTKIGEVVSYRLKIYEDITKQWLDSNGIKYGALTMFPASTYEERASTGINAARFKADIYSKRGWARLFVESDDWQAKLINKLTGKPVYCVQTNTLYK